MKYGYARISKDESVFDRQLDYLNSIGCDEIEKDIISGNSQILPGLERLKKKLKPGDMLCVESLDRLYRNALYMFNLFKYLKDSQITLSSLNPKIDVSLSTPEGKFLVNTMVIFAEFERDLISQRTKSALASAKMRGVKLGRPAMDKEIVDNVIMLLKKDLEVSQIMKLIPVSQPFIYKIRKELLSSQ